MLTDFKTSLRQMVSHLGNPRLLATYAVGFGVLFNFIATFTYVSFHLAAPPYLFSPTLLGALFLTYLVSSPLVPWVGRAIAMFGRRPFVLGTIAVWLTYLAGDRLFNKTTALTDKLSAESGNLNTSVNNVLALTVKMSTKLALSLGYTVLYNTNPIPPLKRADEITSINLQYAF